MISCKIDDRHVWSIANLNLLSWYIKVDEKWVTNMRPWHEKKKDSVYCSKENQFEQNIESSNN